CLPYMARGGRWVMIATLAGDLTNINLRTVFMRGIRLIGSTLRSRTPQFKADLLAELVRTVWPKVTSGEVRPTIYRVLPITQAAEAHAILERGENIGKVVLTV
ncbi:MAG: zinc-binding dehydrogenase, partial [Bacillota bacterium]|nr:zinc-binding dehydrogenase [Bacillota bacterium]